MKCRVEGVCVWVLVVIAAGAGCVSSEQRGGDGGGKETVFAKSVTALDALQKSAGGLPKHLQREKASRNGSEFDPNTYFTVLPHLSLEEGYLLDYVYHYDGMGGYPMLFARKAEESCAIPTEEQLGQALESGESYLDHVRCDGTPEGYFELALFASQARQFYLWWHAGYGETEVIAEKSSLKPALFSFGGGSADVLPRMKSAFTPPNVTIPDDKGRVRVSFCVFSNWGGLIREEYEMRASFPHQITNTASITLCPYECGVMF